MNTLPRPYGNGGPTVRNPATLLPALARKPNAWGESPLHGELPDGLAAHLDALDPRARRRELTLLHRAGVASGFGNAVRAMTAIAEDGRTPDEASVCVQLVVAGLV
ncbi:IS21 family transposase, partial [Bifidobacterium breve]|nr:IS21 family transposase [Bifidobacterium breve]